MTIANHEQADHWNSEEASHWATHQAACDRMLAPFSDMVLAAPAPALRPGDRGADLGLDAGGQREDRARGSRHLQGGDPVLDGSNTHGCAPGNDRGHNTALQRGRHPFLQIHYPAACSAPAVEAPGLMRRAASSAASRSAIRSPAASMPTDRRSRSSGTGEEGPSVVRRCSMRLSTPPSEVARLKTLQGGQQALRVLIGRVVGPRVLGALPVGAIRLLFVVRRWGDDGRQAAAHRVHLTQGLGCQGRR